MVKRGTSKRDRKKKAANSCSRQKAAKPEAAALARALPAGLAATACTDHAQALPSVTQLPESAEPTLPKAGAPTIEIDRSLFKGRLEGSHGGGDPNGSNALILSQPDGGKKKPRAKGSAGEGPELTKSQLRKLRKLQEAKQQRTARSQVLSSLSEHGVSDEQLALLRPLTKRGQRETKKEGLSRAMRMKRAGMELPEGFMGLERRREQKEMSSGDELSGSDSDGGSSTDDGPVASAHPPVVDRLLSAPSKPAGETFMSPEESFMDVEAVKAVVAAARAQLGVPGDPRGDERARALNKDLNIASVDVRNTKVVATTRPPEVEAIRDKLPIIGYEQEIMEAVASSDIVMLSGETGCGKTTQVPQFLLEGGYGSAQFSDRRGLVGVTQPRRVAAISTATRVAYELGGKIGETVGYQVRYDKTVGENTTLKFMTDGILLRELQEDFLLTKYSVVVLDEAHERSLNSDLLLGMLSRSVPLRRRLADAGEPGIFPLKLIVMSATLQLEELTANKKLLPGRVPLIQVPARCYPVTVHFSRKTELDDYTGVAFKKVCRIHKELPPGGVLVFMTGQREVEDLCKKLRSTFELKKRSSAGAESEPELKSRETSGPPGGEDGAAEEDGLPDRFGAADAAEHDVRGAEDSDGEEVDDYEDLEAEEEALEDEEEVEILGGEGLTPEEVAAAEARWDAAASVAGGAETGRVRVLPLYGMLPKEKQDLVFEATPEGHRLIVVATNVAETSLTIPGIRYIVDAGRSKQKILEGHSGMSKFDVRWISKASSQQRAGRAGRVGPGHCYRLFSSAHFNDTFPDFSPPEIVNTPLEGVVLVMKAMGVDNVPNFPFPTPPEREAVLAAEACLTSIMALSSTGQLTDMGKAMARLPVTPRHARLLLDVAQREEEAQAGGDSALTKVPAKRSASGPSKATTSNLLAYAVALTAAVSVEQPFVHTSTAAAAELGEQDGASSAEATRQKTRQRHRQFRQSGGGDALAALAALLGFEASGRSGVWCSENRLHFRHLLEASALRRQLARYLAQGLGRSPSDLLPAQGAEDLAPVPAARVAEALRRGAAAGWADQVARRVKGWEQVQADTQGGRRNKAVRYKCCSNDHEVFLHPNSALHAACPDFVIYKELVRNAKRPYMAVVTEVDAAWLSEASPVLCQLSEALADPPPTYRPDSDSVMAWHRASYGRQGWELPPVSAPYADTRLATATFAAALLSGEVLPCCRSLGPDLAAPPKWASRPENQAQKRVGQLVGALQAARVSSRRALAAQWERSPTFLREELEDWLRKGRGQVLDALWPRMREEATLSQEETARRQKKARKAMKRQKA